MFGVPNLHGRRALSKALRSDVVPYSRQIWFVVTIIYSCTTKPRKVHTMHPRLPLMNGCFQPSDGSTRVVRRARRLLILIVRDTKATRLTPITKCLWRLDTKCLNKSSGTPIDGTG
jgi:hypothetical protein